jgi:hypothetical protein
MSIVQRLFEKGVLRKIFEPAKDALAEGRGRPHTEELCNLYRSPNVSLVFKSRVM